MLLLCKFSFNLACEFLHICDQETKTTDLLCFSPFFIKRKLGKTCVVHLFKRLFKNYLKRSQIVLIFVITVTCSLFFLYVICNAHFYTIFIIYIIVFSLSEDNQPRFLDDLDLKTFPAFLLGVICSALIFSTVLCFVAIYNRYSNI